MPLVTLVQQSSTGTTAFNNTYPDPINKMGNKWSQSGSGLTRSSTGGIVGSNSGPLAYRVDTPSQRVSATGVRGLTNGNFYFLLNSNASSAGNEGSYYQFYLRGGGIQYPYIQRIENGVITNVTSLTTAGTWWTNTLTSVVLDCTIPGTVTASITYGGNTYSTSYSDPYPLPQGNWASYQIWDNGGGNAQTATSLVIETLSVATVPLSIGTRSSSTVTVSTQEPANVDGHSYAYKVTLTATTTATSVGDKLVTGANSYVITAATGTTLTVVGDPFSTTAAPGTGSATTQRSYSTIKSWVEAAPTLTTKDWVWKGVLFKEGTNPGGEWAYNSTGVGIAPTGSDAARYFWLTSAPGQSFRDNMSAGTALAYNTNTGVAIALGDSYAYVIHYNNAPRTLLSGLQIRKTSGSGNFIMSSGAGVIYDSCILQATSGLPFHSATVVDNCLVTKTGGSTTDNSESLTGVTLGYYSQFRNSTFIGPGIGYAFRFHDSYAEGNVIKNCAVFNWNTFTNNITKINQPLSTNNATNLSTLGWTSTGTVVSLTTSSQFNNVASGAEDFRIREYSSLINNAVRDQQYTGDVDIAGRFRSTAATTIGAWSWEAGSQAIRQLTGIQSRNPQTGAVVDMGSYYVSKDYGLDVYPNLVPGRTSPGLYAWGYNPNGGLGLSDTTDRSSPVQVGSLTNWKQVSSGQHTLAITTDGKLWAWGRNDSGQIGDGTTIRKSSPVAIGALTTWKDVATGPISFYSAAIKTDGTLWAWGRDSYGELGSGVRFSSRSSPVQVGTDVNWKKVALGNYHTAAIKSDGKLYTWGRNSSGQLGNGTGGAGTHVSSPAQIGSLSDWYDISCGYNQTLAIKTDGTLWTWGYNGNGQLGLGDTTNRSSPVQVGTLNNWRSVAITNAFGAAGVVAIKTDGTLWAWGRNSNGELALGNTVDYSSPVQVGTLTNWKKISAGYTHFTSIKTDGTLWAWGSNGSGELGRGNIVSYSSPVQVGSLTTWKTIGAGTYYTIAISDGSI